MSGSCSGQKAKKKVRNITWSKISVVLKSTNVVLNLESNRNSVLGNKDMYF